MRFTKMHGAANDYVYVDVAAEPLEESLLARLTVALADRHTGVGSDGLVLICPSQRADFRMRMLNACDGSEAEMCGNAIRCVGKYAHDHGLTDKLDLTIETLGGLKYLKLFPGADGSIERVRVDMGAPVFDPQLIPVAAERPFDLTAEADGKTWTLHCASTGNPHAVTYVDDPMALDLPRIGPLLENHTLFPRRANIEFARVMDRSHIQMRVWERGSGETMACGTGACATAVVSMARGLVDDRVDVALRGGTLTIEWPSLQGSVFMTGPAVEVFTGEIDIDALLGGTL